MENKLKMVIIQNYSKFVRVECSEEGSFPIVAAPFGHGAYTNPIYVGGNGTEVMVPCSNILQQVQKITILPNQLIIVVLI